MFRRSFGAAVNREWTPTSYGCSLSPPRPSAVHVAATSNAYDAGSRATLCQYGSRFLDWRRITCSHNSVLQILVLPAFTNVSNPYRVETRANVRQETSAQTTQSTFSTPSLLTPSELLVGVGEMADVILRSVPNQNLTKFDKI